MSSHKSNWFSPGGSSAVAGEASSMQRWCGCAGCAAGNGNTSGADQLPPDPTRQGPLSTTHQMKMASCDLGYLLADAAADVPGLP